MAVVKSLVSTMGMGSQGAAAVLLVLLTVAAVQSQTAKAQSTCVTELTNLNVCAQFVVPGTTQTTPTAACCGALQSVQHDCLCSTLRISSQLPSRCNLPPLDCGN